MPRLTASARRAAVAAAWASLSFALARLTLSPSASPAPAFAFGLGDAGLEIVADVFKTVSLGGVDSQE
jgi:hypothetical protein